MTPIMPPSASHQDRPNKRTWASERLLLGQANVGFWVVVSSAFILTQPEIPGQNPAVQWGLICLLYAAVQAPFDWLGGSLLPARHPRWPDTLSSWLARWLPGVFVHTAILCLNGLVLMGIAHRLGDLGVLLTACLLTAGLIAVQHRLARWMGHLEDSNPNANVRQIADRVGLRTTRLHVTASKDTSFVGGWVGLPGLESLIVPRLWAEGLTDDELHTVLTRRNIALQTGRRTKGVLAAAAFNLAGMAGVLFLAPDSELVTATGLVTTAAYMTLWTFLGILVLPSVSREAVYQIDREASRRTSTTRVQALIQRLDRDQEDETRRSPLTERVFHPVPASGHRIAALDQPEAPHACSPWRVTRTMLYTSLAGLSVLGRTVHCNIGRPELWALHPGD